MKACSLVAAVLGSFLPLGGAHAQVNSVQAFHEGMMEATVFIAVPIAKDSAEVGTGFFVATVRDGNPKYYLATAAHVLEPARQSPSGKIKVFLRQRTPSGQFRAVETELAAMSGGRPLWSAHRSADLAILPVTKAQAGRAISVSVLLTPAALKSLDLTVGDELFVLGYPHAASSNADAEGRFSILRSGRVASYPAVTRDHMLLDFTVFPGNSGGPVYLAQTTRPQREGGVAMGFYAGVVGILTQRMSTPFANSLSATAGGQLVVNPKDLSVGVVIPAARLAELLETAK